LPALPVIFYGGINMNATFLALVPPILAIVISLITKEVNLSLFAGILVGALMFTGGNPFETLKTIIDIIADKVQGNMGVLIFIILLGMIVYLMNLSGATHRYAKWAAKRLRTKRSTLIATMFLGIIIFVDDYFNCLTVGTVMRPIADRNKVSREKLAYIIDSTAAPICIIAPISSWAAAVSSYLPEGSTIDGFSLFIKAIPSNFYTWMCLALILFTTLLKVDFGKMRKYEIQAMAANLEAEAAAEEEKEKTGNGRVFDLILPVVALIIFSIICMLYTGGLFSGETSTIGEAFANCDAITALAMGGIVTVIFMAILYLPRKVVTVKNYLNGLVEGFKIMVPATLILTLAWTLGGICGSDYLDAGGFVGNFVESNNISLTMMPVLFFIIALILAFSTGTSWGTFAILLPIAVAVFNNEVSTTMVMTVAAVLGGGVCGDHVSPISDTTILSSTGAQCNHINHVESQLQYGIVAAVDSVICYLLGSLIGNVWIPLLIGLVLMFVFVLIVKAYYKKKDADVQKEA